MFVSLSQSCFLLSVNVIGQRMDFYAMVHAFALIVVLYRRRRKAIAEVWPKYCGFLACVITFQYFICIGIPPAPCKGKVLLVFYQIMITFFLLRQKLFPAWYLLTVPPHPYMYQNAWSLTILADICGKYSLWKTNYMQGGNEIYCCEGCPVTVLHSAFVDYPWRSPNANFNSNIIKWLYFPDFIKQPNPVFLVCKYFNVSLILTC